MSPARASRFLNTIFPFGGLPRPVYVLFLARIINRMGDLVRVFLTLYLTQVLALGMKTAGLVVTGAAVASMLGGVVGGKLADHCPRKTVMLIAQSLSASLMALCGFFPTATWLPLVLIAALFFFGAIRPASQALVTDLSPVADRRKAFSLLYMGINIGTAIGPMIAGFLFAEHRRWIFWGDALTTFIGVVLVAAFVAEPARGEVHQGEESERDDPSSSLRAFFSRPVLVAFVSIMVLTQFIYAQTHFALPVLMDSLFGSEGARRFGILMSVNALTVLVCTPVFLQVFKRNRPALNMAFGALAYALGFGALSFISDAMSLVLASTIMWTWGEILFATNDRVFSAGHTPMNHRGRFASIDQVARGIGALLSPAVAGFLAESAGVRGVWGLILILALIVGAGMLILDRRDFKENRL